MEDPRTRWALHSIAPVRYLTELSSGGRRSREPDRLVVAFQFQLSLLPCGLEHLDGVGDVLLRVISHHLHSYPCGAFWNRRKFDEIGNQSQFGQALAHQTRQAFRTHLDANDRGWI